MKRILGKLWKDPVWSKVISVGIIYFLGYLGNVITNGWLINKLSLLFDLVMSFLLYKIALFWTILAVVIILLIRNIRITREHEYMKYNSDTIDNIKYDWQYDYRGYISNIQRMCPLCETTMKIDYYGDSNCPRCEHKIYSNQCKSIRDYRIDYSR